MEERTVLKKFFMTFSPSVTPEGLISHLLNRIDGLQSNFEITGIALTESQWDLVRDKVRATNYMDPASCRFGVDAALFGFPLGITDGDHNCISVVRRTFK